MPLNITSETAVSARSVNGLSVNIAAPYAAGHVLTEGEAKQMNQVLAENVLNNVRKKIGAGVTEGEGDTATTREMTADEAQALIDAYLTTYEPGARAEGAGPRVVDPIEREGRKMAADKVREILKERGLKTKDVDFKELSDQLFTANQDVFLAEAKKIVKAREKSAEAAGALDISALGLGGAA